MKTALIAIDWGTTAFRAYRLGQSGTILEDRQEPAGILQIPDSDFEAALTQFLAPWLHEAPEAPVIAAGMITSRQGWVETGYAVCPADLSDLVRALVPHTTHDGRPVYFVPGLTIRHNGDVPDVIRGEETQVMGLLGEEDPRQLLILPGTHSKWLVAEARRITWFSTFMTGEIYAAVRDHTILGKLAQEGPPDSAAFLQGVAYASQAAEIEGGFLHKLFSARTLPLFNKLGHDKVASYLSGLLIGHEIDEGRRGVRQLGHFDAALLVGRSSLIYLYEKALQYLGMSTRRAPEHCAAQGLWRIAQAAGLIGET